MELTRIAAGLAGTALVVVLGAGLEGCKGGGGHRNDPPPPPPSSFDRTPQPTHSPPPRPQPVQPAPQPDPEPDTNAWKPPLAFEGNRQVGLVATPPPKQENPPNPPGPNWLYCPGHWEYRGSWQWRPGAWYMSPAPHYIWVPGRWSGDGRGSLYWTDGKWKHDK